MFNPKAIAILTPDSFRYSASDFLPEGGERQQRQIAEDLGQAIAAKPKPKTFRETWNEETVNAGRPEWKF